MTDFSDFKAQIADWANRADWSDALVTSFIRQAEQKLNAELRVDRMIQFDDALIASRCAPLPDDWLAMDLVRISNDNGADGFLPIRYKARDEFYNLRDNWTYGYYTIEGRQIYIGGPPDAVNGQTVKIAYYGEVPVFSDDTDSFIYTKYPNLYLNAALMHAAATVQWGRSSRRPTSRLLPRTRSKTQRRPFQLEGQRLAGDAAESAELRLDG